MGVGGPNEQVRKLAHKLGFRFRTNDSRYAGRPHLVFPPRKLMLYTVDCSDLHPDDMDPGIWYWQRRRGKLNAAELALICKGMRLQGWRCEVICDCHARTEEMLERHLLEVIGEALPE